MDTRNIVIGGGEVGQAIADVLNCGIIDIDASRSRGEVVEGYEFLHICIPYSESFEGIVNFYKSKIAPRMTIIHSTVPVGTSTKLGAIHSPVRGKHPNLTESVKTFVKYFGGKGAEEAAREFRGVETECFDKPETTEALKLIDLMQYAASIVVAKEIGEYCDKMGLDYDEVYTKANLSYNRGYEQMASSQFIRPILERMPGKIGGHCVIQNIPKLDIPIVRYIINKNNSL